MINEKAIKAANFRTCWFFLHKHNTMHGSENVKNAHNVYNVMGVDTCTLKLLTLKKERS